MRRHLQRIFGLALVLGLAFNSAAKAEDGFKSIFDGKTLEGWDGKSEFWSIQDGALTGETTSDNPTKGNTFLIWDQGKVDDFELKLKFRIFAGNSGIQYRSTHLGNNVVKGYQADIDFAGDWVGTNYEEKARGVLAKRGQKAVVQDGQGNSKITSLGDPAELGKAVKQGEWNEFHIIAKGNHLTHIINGVVMTEVIDEGEKDSRTSGILALQLHAGPPMKVQFKDVQLKRLKLSKKKR